MSDHPKYGHLPRCPHDPNKLCDYDQLKEENLFLRGKFSDENTKLRERVKKLEVALGID
jgi:hypothetical protein